LIKAIENMCDEFNYNSFKPKMGISIQKNDSHIQLSQLTISTLYRIIQEFVNNTVKYADSENIHISMDTKNNNLHLTLSDDGKGFDFEKELTNSGIGLKNILERIKQLNGSVEINTVIGTTFKIKIPL
jgi:signal transduction histidine kinase